jgi:hypothetical protein
MKLINYWTQLEHQWKAILTFAREPTKAQ